MRCSKGPYACAKRNLVTSRPTTENASSSPRLPGIRSSASGRVGTGRANRGPAQQWSARSGAKTSFIFPTWRTTRATGQGLRFGVRWSKSAVSALSYVLLCGRTTACSGCSIFTDKRCDLFQQRDRDFAEFRGAGGHRDGKCPTS